MAEYNLSDAMAAGITVELDAKNDAARCQSPPDPLATLLGPLSDYVRVLEAEFSQPGLYKAAAYHRLGVGRHCLSLATTAITTLARERDDLETERARVQCKLVDMTEELRTEHTLLAGSREALRTARAILDDVAASLFGDGRSYTPEKLPEQATQVARERDEAVALHENDSAHHAALAKRHDTLRAQAAADHAALRGLVAQCEPLLDAESHDMAIDAVIAEGAASTYEAATDVLHERFAAAVEAAQKRGQWFKAGDFVEGQGAVCEVRGYDLERVTLDTVSGVVEVPRATFDDEFRQSKAEVLSCAAEARLAGAPPPVAPVVIREARSSIEWRAESFGTKPFACWGCGYLRCFVTTSHQEAALLFYADATPFGSVRVVDQAGEFKTFVRVGVDPDETQISDSVRLVDDESGDGAAPPSERPMVNGMRQCPGCDAWFAVDDGHACPRDPAAAPRAWTDEAGDTLTLDDMLMVRESSGGSRHRTASFAPTPAQRLEIAAALSGADLESLRADRELLRAWGEAAIAAHRAKAANEATGDRIDVALDMIDWNSHVDAGLAMRKAESRGLALALAAQGRAPAGGGR